MSITKRRNSQRLASTLDALSSDLFEPQEVTEIQVENEDESFRNDYLEKSEEYCDGVATGTDAISYMSAEAKEPSQGADQTAFQTAFQTAMGQQQSDGANASILQGDPGVSDVGSQATYDTSNVLDLGSDYGVDFDGDEYLQDSIRSVPGRKESASKQARIKKLIARIENVANELEATGRKSLAYRLDIVCNNLEAKYLNK